MADSPKFKIVIDGDTAPIEKSLQDLTTDLKRFQAQLKTATDKGVVADLNNEIKKIGTEMNRIKSVGMGDLSKSVEKSTKAVRQFNPVANSFNQILRETPAFAFSAQTGILALSNNIPQFIDAMQSASKSGGGFIGALKDIGKTLFSFGGIATIAVTAFTIFGDEIFGTSKKVKDADETLKRFKRTFGTAFDGSDIERAKEQIESYEKALKQAVESTAQEATKVTLIVDRLKEGNLSRKETVAAIQQLQKIAPDYFGKLDTERSKISDVVAAYDTYNNALARSIEVQLRIAELTDVIKRRLELQNANRDAAKFLQEQLSAGKSYAQIVEEIGKRRSVDTKLLADQLKIGKVITDDQLKQTSAVKENATEVLALIGVLQEQEKILGDIKDVSLNKIGIEVKGGEKVAELAVSIQKLKQAADTSTLQLFSTEQIRAGVAALEAFEKQVGRLTLSEQETLVSLKIELNEREGIKLGFTPAQIERSIQPLIIDFQKKISAIPIQITVAPEVKVGDPVIPEGAFQPMIDKIQTEAKRAQFAITDGVAKISISAQEQGAIIGAALAGAAEGIGRAIATGTNPFAAAAEGFLSVIGSVVAQFGEQMIKIGAEMLIAKKAIELSFENPALTIAAGVALSILGGLLKNLKFNVPKTAAGGITMGPQLRMVGEAGAEAIIPLHKFDDVVGGGGNQGGELKLVMRGEDLHYSLLQTNLKRNRR